MVMSSDSPVILAISRRPLFEEVPISLEHIDQLISMFHWDSEMAVAHFMLSREILEAD
jgi:hypothetical protein